MTFEKISRNSQGVLTHIKENWQSLVNNVTGRLANFHRLSLLYLRFYMIV
jgi:hypothetical protein